MPTISKGLATWTGIAAAILTAAKPVIESLSALIENTAVHWTTAEKTGLITGAAIAGIMMLGRFAQAVAAIIKQPR